MQIEEQITKLKKTYEDIPLHKDLANSGWDELVSRLGEQQPKQHTAIHWRMFLYTTMVVCIVSGIVFAISKAQPGDTFYGIKKKAEDTYAVLTHQPLAKVTIVPKKINTTISPTHTLTPAQKSTESTQSPREDAKAVQSESHVLSSFTKTPSETNNSQNQKSHGNTSQNTKTSPTSQANKSNATSEEHNNSQEAHQNQENHQSSQSNNGNKKD